MIRNAVARQPGAGSAPVAGRGALRRWPLQPEAIVRGVALVALAAIVLYPIFWLITNSLRPNGEIFKHPAAWLPPTPTLEAYGKVFGTGLWLRIFLNSYFVAGATTLVAITLGALAAYGMSRFAFRGKRPLEFFVVGTQQIPPVAMIIPFFALVRQFGLYDTHLALIITYASFALPLSILMLTTYFATIPIELEESAFIDGAGRLRMLWTIMRPLALPGIVATGVFAFILSFQDLLFAVQLTVSDDMRTIPLGIVTLIGQQNVDWHQMLAASVLASIPLLVLYALAQRYLVSGLTLGAVKQ
jgi:multiple sugar transport system permease protein